MSKLTSAIDAKSLVIGVLLTVIVFMSMGAGAFDSHYVRSKKMKHLSGSFSDNPIRGIPFQRDSDGTVWYYE